MNQSELHPSTGGGGAAAAAGAQLPAGAQPGEMGMFITLDGPITGMHSYFHK